MTPEPASAWLIDKSALVRLDQSPDSEDWLQRVVRGLVRISTITILEIGYSARSVDHFREGLSTPPISSMPVEYVTPVVEDRSVQVLTALAERGHYRLPSVADILIAAVAEVSGLTLLHMAKDFDLISKVTRQPIERLHVRA